MMPARKRRILPALTAAIIGLLVLVALAFLWPKDKTDVRAIAVEQLGGAITMHVEAGTGYVQSVRTRREGETLYCDFRSTFGWPTNPANAKDEFTLQVDGVSQIMFGRPDGAYELVIAADDDGYFRPVARNENGSLVFRGRGKVCYD